MDRVMARRLAGIAALVFAGVAPSARADAIATMVTPDSPYYFTFGSVGGNGLAASTEPGSFEFLGASNTLLQPGSFSLGQFESVGLPQGSSVTYANVPFFVNLLVFPGGASNLTQFDGILIQGMLNGTVSGANQSSVLASITSIQDLGIGVLPFSLSAIMVEAPQLLSPTGVNGGLTSLNAYLAPSSTLAVAPVPEPTSIVAFMAVAAAIGLRRRRKAA